MRDYPSLLADAPAWLDNNDPTVAAQMPLIVSEAEDRIYSELFSHDLDAVSDVGGAPLSLSAGATALPIPADMIQPRHVRISTPGGWQILILRPLEFVVAFNAQVAQALAAGLTVPQIPLYYAVQDSGNYVIAPTPAAGLLYTVAYKQRPVRLSAVNPSNFLTAKCYAMLRALCCAKLAMFVIDDRQDSLVAKYEADYKALLAVQNGLYPRSQMDEYRALSVKMQEGGGTP